MAYKHLHGPEALSGAMSGLARGRWEWALSHINILLSPAVLSALASRFSPESRECISSKQLRQTSTAEAVARHTETCDLQTLGRLINCAGTGAVYECRKPS